MCLDSPYRLGCACVLLWFSAMALHAQDSQPEPAKGTPKLPTIADEPKTIDPAAFMPTKLAAKVTVDFSDSSLREVLTWLREKQGLVVLLENDALSDIGVLPGDPVSDRLDKTPIYLFLNRLRSLGIAWYYEDDILHITSEEVAKERRTTIPHNIGDLIDAGYDLNTLGGLIISTIEPSSWDEVGGSGVVSFLGDVIFVHQTDNVQREVHGLLAALRKHGRQHSCWIHPSIPCCGRSWAKTSRSRSAKHHWRRPSSNWQRRRKSTFVSTCPSCGKRAFASAGQLHFP